MTDEEKKKKKREQSWIEEFLYNVMKEVTSQMMNYFFDEWLGWHYVDVNDRSIDQDEIEEWEW